MEKLIILANLGQTLYGGWVWKRLISYIIAAVGLVLVAAIMIGALLIGGLYALYTLLLQVTLSPYLSGLVVGLLATGITASLVAALMMAIQRIGNAPRKLIATSPVREILESFVDGFLGKEPTK